MPPFPVEPRYKSASSLNEADASVSSDTILRKLQRAHCAHLSTETVPVSSSASRTSNDVSKIDKADASSSPEQKTSSQCIKSKIHAKKTPRHVNDIRNSPPSSPVTPPRRRTRVPDVSHSRPPRIPLFSEERSDDSKTAENRPSLPVPHRNELSSEVSTGTHVLPPTSPVDKPLSSKSSRRRRKTEPGRQISVDGTEETQILPFTSGKRNSPSHQSLTRPWCAICAQEGVIDLEHTCELRLNQAREAMIISFFENVPGLGRRLANRVISARTEGGPFLSAADFDRRISRLSFARLNSSASSCGFSVSLEMTLRPMPGRTIAGCSIRVSIAIDGNSCAKQKTLPSSPVVTLSTWNAAHFSLRSRFVKQKMRHLVRFSRDASPLILALQEVYEDVPAYVAQTLTIKGRKNEKWCSCSPEDRDTEKMMQSFCYRSDVITGTDLSTVIPEVLLEGFLRPPAVAMFSPRCEDVGIIHEQTIALVNVHLSTRFYASEVAKLPPLLEFVRDHISALGGNPDMVMCLGDFNVSADAECYATLKESGFIELVRPPNSVDSSSSKQFVTTPTTVGGNWYDNIFMATYARQALENAWCFDFGGRCAALADSSAYEYAGNRRSQRSDHLALVAQFKFPAQAGDVPV